MPWRFSRRRFYEGPGPRKLQLEDLDLEAMFGQSATNLDGEGLPEEAIVPDDEAVAEDDIGALNDHHDEV